MIVEVGRCVLSHREIAVADDGRHVEDAVGYGDRRIVAHRHGIDRAAGGKSFGTEDKVAVIGYERAVDGRTCTFAQNGERLAVGDRDLTGIVDVLHADALGHVTEADH